MSAAGGRARSQGAAAEGEATPDEIRSTVALAGCIAANAATAM